MTDTDKDIVTKAAEAAIAAHVREMHPSPQPSPVTVTEQSRWYTNDAKDYVWKYPDRLFISKYSPNRWSPAFDAEDQGTHNPIAEAEALALIESWRAISAIGDRIGGQPDATPEEVLGMVNGHCDAYIEMESECATLAAENARLREALRKVEWEGMRIIAEEEHSCCPDCGELRSSGKHAADCQLAAALAGGQEDSK